MLSYADRLKSMRETKIRHTQEKRIQNGYTDIDDFGTVPISPGYRMEPWYNSTNGSFPLEKIGYFTIRTTSPHFGVIINKNIWV